MDTGNFLHGFGVGCGSGFGNGTVNDCGCCFDIVLGMCLGMVLLMVL